MGLPASRRNRRILTIFPQRPSEKTDVSLVKSKKRKPERKTMGKKVRKEREREKERKRGGGERERERERESQRGIERKDRN